MRAIEAIDRIRSFANTERCVFTTGELSRILGIPRADKKLNATLRALVAAGALSRPTRGVYVIDELAGGDVLEMIARKQRDEPCCIAYESAASAHGIISQLFPRLLTIATVGREGLVETKWGRIEYVHTSMPGKELLAHAHPGRILPMADAETTLLLMRRARRASLELAGEEA